MNSEQIAKLIEGERQERGPKWLKHIDQLISAKLTVTAMANVLNKAGYEIKRQSLSEWLIRNRYEETSYLKRRKTKSIVDRVVVGASVSHVDESHQAKPEQGNTAENIVADVKGNHLLIDDGSKPARKMSEVDVAARAAETMKRIHQIVDEKCNKPNTGD